MITRNDRGGFIGGVCQWRSSAMITHFPSNSFHSSLPFVYLQFISIHPPAVSNISHVRKSPRIKNRKIGKRENTRARGLRVIENENCLGKLAEVASRRFNQKPTTHRPPFGIDLTRTVHESRRIVNYPRTVSAVRMHKRLDRFASAVAVAAAGGGGVVGWRRPFLSAAARFSSLFRENRNENDCIELNLHDSLTGP